MGVYIKGMEMPTSCYDCPVECEGDICGITKGGCTWDVRPPHCPLVPVPAHGRLIDADAIPYNKIMLVNDDFYYGTTKPYIDRMPTIIPAEEGEQ